MTKHLLCALVVAFVFNSCESFLTEDPKGVLTPDKLFKDKPGLDMAITGMYNRFRETNNNCARQFYVSSGDDVTAVNYNTLLSDFDRFYFYNLNVWLIYLWQYLYQSIQTANNIIIHAEVMDIDRTFIEHRVGQAYIIRALNYFQLVRIFGRVPLVTGIEIDYTIPRASVEDIYALIEADLKKAETYLPEKHLTAPYFQHGINIAPNDAAAKAMIASVWMTQAGWPLKKGTAYYDRAAAKYKEIIDREIDYGYKLEPDILTLVKHPDGNFINEIVWGSFLNQDNGFTDALSEVPQESYGWAQLCPEIEFFYNFPEGPRKDAFFLTKVFMYGDDYCVDWDDPETRFLHPYFKKNIHRTEWTSYNDETHEWNNQGIGPHGKTRYLFRYADILLLYAEAVAFGSGNIDQFVVDCVLRVQNRAGVPDERKVTYGMSREAFQKAVLDERRWETCGMEMSVMGRFFTMQRHEILHLQGQYRIVYEGMYPFPYPIPFPPADPSLNPKFVALTTPSEEFYYFPIPGLEVMIAPQLQY